MNTTISPKERFRKGFVLVITLALWDRISRDHRRLYRGAAAGRRVQRYRVPDVLPAAADVGGGAIPWPH